MRGKLGPWQTSCLANWRDLLSFESNNEGHMKTAIFTIVGLQICTFLLVSCHNARELPDLGATDVDTDTDVDSNAPDL